MESPSLSLGVLTKPKSLTVCDMSQIVSVIKIVVACLLLLFDKV